MLPHTKFGYILCYTALMGAEHHLIILTDSVRMNAAMRQKTPTLRAEAAGLSECYYRKKEANMATPANAFTRCRGPEVLAIPQRIGWMEEDT
ncbi:hypothetical protein PSP6_680070 [Paraburkholderia tropica]|nr:hypothetical protein PSP6_680070 [Paraburkholderia tropica]